ncbi:MAG: hypothetical protein IJ774_01495 [Selenomonadaceae bacterium]|nr:hypothetical protein [Selenomonadaceae bacterium]
MSPTDFFCVRAKTLPPSKILSRTASPPPITPKLSNARKELAQRSTEFILTATEYPADMDVGRPQLKQDVSPAGTRVADVDNTRINNPVLHAVALHAQWRLSLLLSFAARKKVVHKHKINEHVQSKRRTEIVKTRRAS